MELQCWENLTFKLKRGLYETWFILKCTDNQAKFSEFGRLIDVHDTGNGFAFVTYNHKKVRTALAASHSSETLHKLLSFIEIVLASSIGVTHVIFNPCQEAKKAIREMNGATIAGQEIKVGWRRFPIKTYPNL